MILEKFEFRQGELPFLLSLPHSGTEMPEGFCDRLTEKGQEKRDTDWFLPELYDFCELANVSRIASKVSRYVVDLNRSSDNQSLYPGQSTTGLCPVKTFSNEPIYLAGKEPAADEIQDRVESYWKPYHDQLRTELERLVSVHGFAVLLDGHSIAGQLPMLFDGQLPDFNFGTNHGETCLPSMQRRIDEFALSIEGFSAVVNQRFVGGFITRHYGSLPNVNAVQLELVQATYMDESELVWDEPGALKVRPVIQTFVSELQEWANTMVVEAEAGNRKPDDE